MKQDIHLLGRHAAIYSLGNILAKLTSFLMLPIYTRYLTPADYGVLELLQMTIDLVGMLAGVTLASSVFRFYAEYDEDERKSVVSTAAIGVVTLASLAAVLGIVAAPMLSAVILREHGDALYFRLFFLIFVANTAELVPFMMCRALHRSRLVVTLNLARLVALLTLNIVFVVHLRMGVTGILISSLVVSSLMALGMTTFLFRQVGYSFSPAKFKEMAAYSYPVIFVSLGNFFLLFSDRYFLNHYVGTAAVGIYALATRFAVLLGALVYNPFMQIWGPQRFAIAKQPKARDVFSRVFVYINICLGVVALAISLFAHDVLKVMADRAFVSAYQLIPLLLVVQIVHFWSGYNNLGLLITKTTKKFAFGSLVAVPSVLLLNFLLVPRYGMMGAVIATFAAYVLRLIVVHHMAQQEYRIDYAWGRVARLYALLGAAFVLRVVLGEQPIVSSVVIGIGLLLITSFLVFKLILTQGERAAALEMVQKRAKPLGPPLPDEERSPASSMPVKV